MSAWKCYCSVCLTFYVHFLKTYRTWIVDFLFFFTLVGFVFSFSFCTCTGLQSGVSMILGIAEGLVIRLQLLHGLPRDVEVHAPLTTEEEDARVVPHTLRQGDPQTARPHAVARPEVLAVAHQITVPRHVVHHNRQIRAVGFEVLLVLKRGRAPVRVHHHDAVLFVDEAAKGILPPGSAAAPSNGSVVGAALSDEFSTRQGLLAQYVVPPRLVVHGLMVPPEKKNRVNPGFLGSG